MNWEYKNMHKPVLLEETLEALDIRENDLVVDGTANGGGQARAILDKLGPEGRLLAIDWDREATEKLREIFRGEERVTVDNDNYANLLSILERRELVRVDALLLDLGFSSNQIEESGRGFSFLRDEPLYMTYNEAEESVASILSRLNERELENIIRELGGERMAGRVARAIKEAVKKEAISSSLELAEIARKALPNNYERGRIDPATRTFQALRIYANHELENLDRILKDLPLIMDKGGRVVIITFHSLEDGLVKRAFRSKDYIEAGAEELANNIRSRSAKLRTIKF